MRTFKSAFAYKSTQVQIIYGIVLGIERYGGFTSSTLSLSALAIMIIWGVICHLAFTHFCEIFYFNILLLQSAESAVAKLGNVLDWDRTCSDYLPICAHFAKYHWWCTFRLEVRRSLCLAVIFPDGEPYWEPLHLYKQYEKKNSSGFYIFWKVLQGLWLWFW